MKFIGKLPEPNRAHEHVIDPDSGKIFAVFVNGEFETEDEAKAVKLKGLGYSVREEKAQEPERKLGAKPKTKETK